MPYAGKSVSIEEMLDILITSGGLSEATAVVQLQRAIEEKAFAMRVPDGPNEDGEEEWVDLSPTGRSASVAALAQWRDRGEIPLTQESKNIIRGIRALRFQFEAACNLVETQRDIPRAVTKGPAPGTVDRYGESDRARFPEVEALMKAGKTLTAATTEIGPTLEGPATPESKAKRLRDLFQKVKAAN